ncbi:glycine-rich protein [Natrialba chahannaoensis]
MAVGGPGGYVEGGEPEVGGFNGGGDISTDRDDPAGGGGGATDIRFGGTDLSDRILVAGGGGGGGSDGGRDDFAGDGGAGGANEGAWGEMEPYGGGGGTQSEGGEGGIPEDESQTSYRYGEDGELLYGGDADATASMCGGAGGGGYYGGGSGAAERGSGHFVGYGGGGGSNYIGGYYGGGSGAAERGSGHFVGYGGGGGSNYIGSGFTNTSNSRGSNWGSGSDGEVTIEYVEAAEPPIGLQVQYDDESIDLNWNSGENVVNYNIYRSTSSNVSTSGSPYASTSSTSYTDSSVSTDTRYYYTVTGVDATGEETDSTSTENALTAPMQPSVSVSTQGMSEIDVSMSGDGDEFHIYRSTSSGSTQSDYTHITSTSSNGYSDSGLINGQTYYYRITAENAQATTDLSNEDFDTTDLPSPTLGSAIGGDRKITIEFEAEDNNSDGSITVSRDGTDVTSVTPGTTSYTDTDADLDGQEYTYQLMRDTGDATAESGTERATTNLPALEDMEVIDVDGRHATIQATDPSNNSSGYRLLLREDDEGSYEQDGDDLDPVNEGETVEFVTTKLLDGKLYGATAETFTNDATAREDQ